MKRFALIAVAVSLLSTLSVLHGATPAVAAPPSCTHLVVGATTVEDADGAGYTTILIVNVAGRCTLEGYASVKFFSRRVAKVFGHDVHRASMVFLEPKPKRVTLRRGSVASIGVTWNDDPTSNQSCPATQWTNVVFTQGVRQMNFQPPTNATPCGENIWVTPIEAGAEPRTTFG